MMIMAWEKTLFVLLGVVLYLTVKAFDKYMEGPSNEEAQN